MNHLANFLRSASILIEEEIGKCFYFRLRFFAANVLIYTNLRLQMFVVWGRFFFSLTKSESDLFLYNRNILNKRLKL